MYFRLLHDEATGAASYLLADLEAGEAVLIDPRGADGFCRDKSVRRKEVAAGTRIRRPGNRTCLLLTRVGPCHSRVAPS